MKFPSLFRTPKYQRFHITPRYYDPVKEEIEARTSRMKRNLELQRGDHPSDEEPYYTSRIAGSLKKARSSGKSSVGFMQLVIILLLSGVVVGYLYFGNIALYTFLLVSSVLLYLKMTRRI